MSCVQCCQLIKGQSLMGCRRSERSCTPHGPHEISILTDKADKHRREEPFNKTNSSASASAIIHNFISLSHLHLHLSFKSSLSPHLLFSELTRFQFQVSLVMMMMSGRSSRHPFTEAQWQQLEHQALFFKFMVSGLPIPPDLIFSIHGKTSFPTQPHHIGWTCFQLGLSNKIDPEPTRCRRTDGKKWRCSRQAFGDSKYCERHMHRGKSRPRKPLDSKPFPCSKSSSMAESRTQQSGATHSPLTSSETTQDSTFMTLLGIQSGWSPPKQQRTMYQFIEESPQDKRDSWLNLVI